MHLKRKHKKITPTNSRGRDAKLPTFRGKTFENRQKSSKIFAKVSYAPPKVSLDKTRAAMLYYTGGEGGKI
jgi:hypothetical protein